MTVEWGKNDPVVEVNWGQDDPVVAQAEPTTVVSEPPASAAPAGPTGWDFVSRPGDWDIGLLEDVQQRREAEQKALYAQHGQVVTPPVEQPREPHPLMAAAFAGAESLGLDVERGLEQAAEAGQAGLEYVAEQAREAPKLFGIDIAESRPVEAAFESAVEHWSRVTLPKLLARAAPGEPFESVMAKAEEAEWEIAGRYQGTLGEQIGSFVGVFANPLYLGAFGLAGKIAPEFFNAIVGMRGAQARMYALQQGWSIQNADRLGRAMEFAFQHAISGAKGIGAIGAMEGYAEYGTFEGFAAGAIQGAGEGVVIGPVLGGLFKALGIPLKVGLEAMTPKEARRSLGIRFDAMPEAVEEAYIRGSRAADALLRAGKPQEAAAMFQRQTRAYDALLKEAELSAPVGTAKRRAEPAGRKPSVTRPAAEVRAEAAEMAEHAAEPPAKQALRVKAAAPAAKAAPAKAVEPAPRAAAAREVAEAAKKRIAERTIRKGPQRPGARPGGTIIIDNVVDYTIYGAAKIMEMTSRAAKGVRVPGYREWVKSMLAEAANPQAAEFFGRWKEVIWRNARILANVNPRGWTTKSVIKMVTESKMFTPDVLRQRVVGIDERIAALKARGETKGIGTLLRERKELRELIAGEGRLVRTPGQLLEYAMKHEARASSAGYKQGILDEMATVKEARDFIESNVPEAERAMLRKVLDSMALRKVAKGRLKPRLAGAEDTPVGWNAFVKSVNRIMENYERRVQVKRLKVALSKSREAGVRPKIVAAINELMAPFTIGKSRERKVKEAQARLTQAQRDWAKALEDNPRAAMESPDTLAANPLTPIHHGVLEQAKGVVAKLGKKDVSKLTPKQIETLAGAIENLLHQSKTINRTQASRRFREIREMITAAREQVESYRDASRPITPDERRLQARFGRYLARNLIRSWIDPIRQTELLAGRGDNILRDTFWLEFNRAQAEGSQFRRADQRAWHKFLAEKDFSAADIQNWSEATTGAFAKTEQITLQLPTARISTGRRSKGLGKRQQTLTLTKGEAIDLLLHTWDGLTRREVTKNKSEGVRLESSRFEESVHLTQADIWSIQQQIRNEDPRMWEVARFLFEQMNAEPRRNTVNRLTMELLGREIALRSDHWPRRRDPGAMEQDPNKMMWGWLQSHLEQMGILKERHATDAPVVIEDGLMKYWTHTNRIAALHKGRAVHDARRLLYGHTGRDFRNSIRQRFVNGQEYIDYLRKYTSDYEGLDNMWVRDDVAAFWNRAAGFAIRKFQVGRLGWNPMIGAYQRVSELHLIPYVGLENLVGGRKLGLKKAQVDAEMEEWWPLGLDRAEGGAHQILTPGLGRNAIRQFYGMPTKMERAEDKFMHLIRAIDAQVIRDIWRSTRYEGMQKGLKGEELMRYTAERSQEIVDRSQPQFAVTSLPPFMRAARQSQWVRGIPGVPFSSQRKQHFNMLIEAGLDIREGRRAIREGRVAEGRAQIKAGALKIATAGVLNPVIVHLIRRWYLWALGGAGAAFLKSIGQEPRVERDKPVDEDAMEMVSRALGNMPGPLGALSDFAMRRTYKWLINPEAAAFPLETPWGAMAGDIGTLITRTGRVFGDALEEGGVNTENVISAFQALLRGASAAGLPGGPAEQQLRPFLPQPTWQRKQNLYTNFWSAVDRGDEKKARKVWAEMRKEGITLAALKSSARGRGKTVPPWLR